MNIDLKDTSERLLYAAINLIAEKGYKSVSTKEIAKEASLSEMTLFRHFGTKENMLKAAIDRFYYTTSMKDLFVNNIDGLFSQINKHPRQLKELLIDYFMKMEEKGHIKMQVEVESLAMSYLYMLYGEFVSRSFVEGHQITWIKEEDFINTSVQLYVNALKVNNQLKSLT